MKALDLTRQRFGRLVAESKVNGRWICRCDCGEITSVVVCHLREGTIRSCGCLSRERSRTTIVAVSKLGQEARTAMQYQGTIICHIQGDKPHRDSTTGVRGVALHHTGQYRAYLTLQQRQIHLKIYDTLEEAKQARKEGEERYYTPVIESFKRGTTDKE